MRRTPSWRTASASAAGTSSPASSNENPSCVAERATPRPRSTRTESTPAARGGHGVDLAVGGAHAVPGFGTGVERARQHAAIDDGHRHPRLRRDRRRSRCRRAGMLKAKWQSVASASRRSSSMLGSASRSLPSDSFGGSIAVTKTSAGSNTRSSATALGSSASRRFAARPAAGRDEVHDGAGRHVTLRAERPSGRHEDQQSLQ